MLVSDQEPKVAKQERRGKKNTNYRRTNGDLLCISALNAYDFINKQQQQMHMKHVSTMAELLEHSKEADKKAITLISRSRLIVDSI